MRLTLAGNIAATYFNLPPPRLPGTSSPVVICVTANVCLQDSTELSGDYSPDCNGMQSALNAVTRRPNRRGESRNDDSNDR